jgi:hypothetical protein
MFLLNITIKNLSFSLKKVKERFYLIIYLNDMDLDIRIKDLYYQEINKKEGCGCR